MIYSTSSLVGLSTTSGGVLVGTFLSDSEKQKRRKKKASKSRLVKNWKLGLHLLLLLTAYYCNLEASLVVGWRFNCLDRERLIRATELHHYEESNASYGGNNATYKGSNDQLRRRRLSQRWVRLSR
ncbi:Hypothetical predicted protein [Olea europaea subsp. europaea]|uniref:Uncharacterized protein n=1 Tax=Olea europaea subsp. europaea TaxID=158383 RepID=A0A8S0Q0S2_OLEEU|nr:Hypothetical predicted protein [Olea europaea subsp. europaea]